MIHGDSYKAGYADGYAEGARDIQRQIALLARAPIMMSGSQPSRALADAVARQPKPGTRENPIVARINPQPGPSTRL